MVLDRHPCRLRSAAWLTCACSRRRTGRAAGEPRSLGSSGRSIGCCGDRGDTATRSRDSLLGPTGMRPPGARQQIPCPQAVAHPASRPIPGHRPVSSTRVGSVVPRRPPTLSGGRPDSLGTGAAARDRRAPNGQRQDPARPGRRAANGAECPLPGTDPCPARSVVPGDQRRVPRCGRALWRWHAPADTADCAIGFLGALGAASVLCHRVPGGSWGGQRPSLGDYVMVTRPTDGATATGGA